MANMTDENAAGSKNASRNNNSLVAVLCVAFVAGMVGMSYASVPLYRLFCQVTGFDGTTQRVEQVSSVILDNTIRVTFDTNVAQGLPWNFKPLQREIVPRIGETVEVKFAVENTSSEPTRGQAIFNVSPVEAGAYFNKVQCFCFDETDLAPGERREMSVVFYVDPEITKTVDTKDIGTLTLSYTYYPRAGAKPVAANDGVAKGVQQKL
jgi:cytochrome c oxidase assembly protein subunit 11